LTYWGACMCVSINPGIMNSLKLQVECDVFKCLLITVVADRRLM
jgi:hypothetical protein